MSFPKEIFKAYDIRGLVEGELSEELAYAVGRAFVVLLREKGIALHGKSLIVGQDMRATSPAFAEQVMRGINAEGVDVIDIGMTTTPVFNVSCAEGAEFAGGIMVTASHNPSEYNGFKLTMDTGLPIGKDTGMGRLYELADAGEWVDAEVAGTIEKRDVRDAYIEKLFSFVDTAVIKPLKIVIDGGNGMGDVIFPLWLKKLPVEVTYMYMEPDGTFPNHEANPLKSETLLDLSKKVVELGADFGFALDGDADRVGFVDETGAVIDPSAVAGIIGLEFLKTHPKAHMLYDLRSSRVLKDVFEAQGATTEPCMVGHANIKKMMKEVNAQFASELSLHIFFGNMHNLESTDLCLLSVLALLSTDPKKISEHAAAFAKYAHSGEMNFEVEDKDGAIARLKEVYGSQAKKELELDGLWLELDWGWFNVRKSNTEPVLRLNLETEDRALTEEKVAEVKKVILGE
ncbi:MAG: phosphomannomutase/phosphoglucomutase [Candidatus Magasanikbacteria bacterium]|nr:phosphomannomutase/phosphoglucomutase [Candidatus Magasanikbacteria bacterium]